MRRLLIFFVEVLMDPWRKIVNGVEVVQDNGITVALQAVQKCVKPNNAIHQQVDGISGAILVH